MKNDSLKNADRFLGFADAYDRARPALPDFPVIIILKYLGYRPSLVIDLGSGTGLSTVSWKGRCNNAVGIEPNEDMLAIARLKQTEGIRFMKAFSHETGLENACADVVVCSQSFHWMEPDSTLAEVNRILKPGGVFAVVDCDWPPVTDWEVDKAFTDLFSKVKEIENADPQLKGASIRYEKDRHLANIKGSGYFRYAREIVFSNTESCSATRLVDLATTQGSLQAILKSHPDLVDKDCRRFEMLVQNTFGEDPFEIQFSYRMRIAVK